MKLKIRKYIEDDLPALVTILNEDYKDYDDFDYAYEFIPYTEDTFRSKVVQRYPTLLVAEEHEVKGFITLYQAPWGDGIGMFIVKQSAIRKGIEDILLSRIEKEAKSGRIVAILSSGSPRIAFFQEKGFEIYGGLYHMIKGLKIAHQSTKLDGVTLRSLKSGEEETLTRDFYLRGLESRFQPGFLEEWKEMDPSFTRAWIHIAEMDGRIVSVACTRQDYEYNKHFNEKRAIIGPVITLPEYRRQGIAKALMIRVLNFLISQKIETVALKVLEDNLPAVGLYSGLGFEIKHHWKFLRKYLTKGPPSN